jgi:hypothetical protein
MFVGHALLAFALVGGAAALLRDRRTALRLGVVAAAFATIPDVDMSYALVGLTGVDGGALAAAGAFWEASTLGPRAGAPSLSPRSSPPSPRRGSTAGVGGPRRRSPPARRWRSASSRRRRWPAVSSVGA